MSEAVVQPEASVVSDTETGGTLLEKLQSVPLEPTPDDPRGAIEGTTESPFANVAADVAEATGRAEPAEELASPAEDATPAVEESQSEVSPDDALEAYLAELTADPTDETAVADAEAIRNGSQRLQGRVSDLANEKNQAMEMVTALQQKLDQQTQTMQTLQRSMLSMYERMQKPQSAPEPRQAPVHSDDPVEQLLGELSPRMKQEFEGTLNPLLKRLNMLEQREVQRQKLVQQQHRQAQLHSILQQRLDQAKELRPLVIPDLPEEMQNDAELGDTLDELFITLAASREANDLREVLPDMRKAVGVLSRAALRAGRSRGQKLVDSGATKAPKVPTSAGAPNVSKQGSTPLYSTEQLLKAGYAGTPDAIRDKFAKMKGVEPARGYI